MLVHSRLRLVIANPSGPREFPNPQMNKELIANAIAPSHRGEALPQTYGEDISLTTTSTVDSASHLHPVWVGLSLMSQWGPTFDSWATRCDHLTPETSRCIAYRRRTLTRFIT